MLVWRMLRARWAVFTGSFIALALGVCLMATTALSLAAANSDRRVTDTAYSAVDVVVAGENRISIRSGANERTTITTVEVRPLSADIFQKLGKVDGVAALVPNDRLQAQMDGGPTGRDGRPRLIGVKAADHVSAARLAAGIRLALEGRPARVLVGDERVEAIPDPDRPLLSLVASLLGTAAGVAGFAALFVVVGTFSFAVAERRQEFALLRLAGMTRAQVYRLVLSEAVLLGLLAAAAGCALAFLVAPLFGRWLAQAKLAPADFQISFTHWPFAMAAGAGIAAALFGAWTAARKAARVQPLEAMRESAAGERVMSSGRWLLGLACLGGAALLLPQVLKLSAEGAAYVMLLTMLLLGFAALFAPVAVPGLVALLFMPFRSIVAHLARTDALAAVGRTSATVTPVLITLGLAGSLLVTTATGEKADSIAARERLLTPAMVIATGERGLNTATVKRLADLPGVRAVIPTKREPVYIDTGNPGRYEFQALFAPPAIADALKLPVVQGSIDHLRGTDTVVVSQKLADAQGWRLGDSAPMFLADSTPIRPKLVGLLANSLDMRDVVILPPGLQREQADALYLLFHPGMQIDAIAARIAGIATQGGGRFVRASEQLFAEAKANNQVNRIAILAVAGMAILYTGIAIANTFLMATSGRARDFATLRLNGATPRQLVAMVAVETVLVTGVAVILAAAVIATVAGVVHTGLRTMLMETPLDVPWVSLGLIVLACLLVALVSSLVPALLTLRTPAIRIAASRE